MSDPTALSPLKQAFLALQASQNRVAELEAAQVEPIAIIGVACRFPGEKSESDDSHEDLWTLLRDAKTTLSRKNLDRWRACGATLFTASETEALHWGALLEGPDRFDTQFFGISPREAISMDPQQRLLLEVSWHALENAAIPPDSTFGSNNGVYFGLSANDYAQLQLANLKQSEMEPHFASGGGHSVASGRISYTFGWHGPSVSIDTACSSSLVAVHLACKALQSGDCTMALAGGVNLILSPESSIAFSRAGMLSSTGHVRSFGLGDGFVRGEGCGVIVLKRLSAARRAGDRILGVILGSSVNHDGPGSGLTIPNGQAQAMLLRAALASAGLDPSAVGYVEAHGTGTRLGDPIEAEALGEVFAGPREAPLRIGSVKTNLGHLEAAAGIAGLIKLVLALGHAEIPAQLQDGPFSEHIRWNELPLEVATRHQPWHPIAGRRIGGVSAFGFSGTNAHVIVEAAPLDTPQQTGQQQAGPEPEAEVPVLSAEVLVLSAKTGPALGRMVERFIAHLASHPEQDWRDVCHTAATGRTHFKHRLAVVAATMNEGLALLRAHARKQPSIQIERGQTDSEIHPHRGVLLGGSAAPDTLPDSRLDRARTLAEAYVAGREVDWAAWNQGRVRRRIALPGYAFERRRHWFTPSTNQSAQTHAQTHAEPSGRATGHPLLGRQLQLAGEGARYEQRLCLDPNLDAVTATVPASPAQLAPEEDLAWLREHRIQGRAIMPATALIELLLAAADRLPGVGEPLLEDAVFPAPMPLDSSRLMQVAVDPVAVDPVAGDPVAGDLENLGLESRETPAALSRDRVRVFSTSAAEAEPSWILHAEGYVHRRSASQPSGRSSNLEPDSPPPPHPPPLEALRARCSEVIEADAFYALMHARGADFGPRFRGVERIWYRPGEALGQIRLEHLGTRLHPASFDACLQVVAAAVLLHDDAANPNTPSHSISRSHSQTPDRSGDAASPALLPFHVSRLLLLSSSLPYETCFVHAELLPSSNPRHTLFHIALLAPTPDHAPFATLTLTFAKPAESKSASTKQYNVADWFYRLRWVQAPVKQVASTDAGEWLLIVSADSPNDPLEGSLAQHLQAAGQTVSVLRLGDPASQTRELGNLITQRTTGVLYLHTPKTPAMDFAADSTLPTRIEVEEFLSIARELTHRRPSSLPLYVVTRNAYPVGSPTEIVNPLEAILCGLAATILAEQATLRCLRLDITADESVSAAPQIVTELLSSSAESCVAFRSGVRYIQRLERFSPNLKASPVRLTFNPTAGLNGLKYKPSARKHPAPMELEIEVRAAALNFHDVLIALGRLSDADALGVECSGIVTATGADVLGHKIGDEVIALTANTFADYAIARQSLTLPKPAALSFAEAASLPVAYLTADFCLSDIAGLHAGQTVLIHAASGGVGLAALHLCQRAGATVFATAGSESKREYLRFLGVEHVLTSRSNAFAAEIMTATAGRGVDIVLNSLTGTLTDTGLSTVAPSGRFIDIGATDLRDAAETAALYPGVTYRSVDLSLALRQDSQRMKNRLSAILADVAAGRLPRLPLELFPFSQTFAAFQRMAAAKHVGKLVLVPDSARSTNRDIRIGPEDSYIVTGGMRGLGLEAVKWLSSSGAGRVVVIGRQPPSPETTHTFARLFEAGTHIAIVQGDVSEYSTAKEAVALAGPALKGIIHCAAVLDDAPIEQQTWERFSRVLKPKADAAWLLHRLTTSTALDFFVLYSSWASIAGSPGAANYCAANMFLDSLAHYRHALGLPATSINWGAWAETGIASRPFKGSPLRNGFRPLSPDAGIEALAFAIQHCDEPQVAIADVDWPRSFQLMKERPDSSVYAGILADQGPIAASRLKPAVVNVRRWLYAVRSAPAHDRRRILAEQLTGVVAKILSLRADEKIDSLQPLEELGLDSILAMELTTEIARLTEIPMPVALLFDYPTIASLTGYIFGLMEPHTESGASSSNLSPVAMPSALLDRIEELSDDEVDRLIQQRR